MNILKTFLSSLLFLSPLLASDHIEEEVAPSNRSKFLQLSTDEIGSIVEFLDDKDRFCLGATSSQLHFIVSNFYPLWSKLAENFYVPAEELKESYYKDFKIPGFLRVTSDVKEVKLNPERLKGLKELEISYEDTHFRSTKKEIIQPGLSPSQKLSQPFSNIDSFSAQLKALKELELRSFKLKAATKINKNFADAVNSLPNITSLDLEKCQEVIVAGHSTPLVSSVVPSSTVTFLALPFITFSFPFFAPGDIDGAIKDVIVKKLQEISKEGKGERIKVLKFHLPSSYSTSTMDKRIPEELSKFSNLKEVHIFSSRPFQDSSWLKPLKPSLEIFGININNRSVNGETVEHILAAIK